jgi:four helix bundle protein
MNVTFKNPKAEDRRPKEGRNLKAEGRNPTRCDGATARREEGRSPKSEEDGAHGDQLRDSMFSSWGHKNDSEIPVLHEGLSEKTLPSPLDERTAQFGEAIIHFAKRVPKNPVNERLISQLVGAATSIGANYCEADDSVSGKELKQKIGTCRKESKETMFFLRMIASAEPMLADEARSLWREAKEINLIFGAIWRK